MSTIAKVLKAETVGISQKEDKGAIQWTGKSHARLAEWRKEIRSFKHREIPVVAVSTR